MLERKSILLVTILLLSINIFSQSDSTKIILSGKIINAENLAPISFAHILVSEKNLGTATDEKGEFSIYIEKDDIIVFSALGFQYDRLSFVDSLIKNTYFVIIKLIPKVYQIESVNIFPFKTYKDFKKTFLEYEKVEEEIVVELLIQSLNAEDLSVYAPCNLGISPITALYNIFSKYEKSKRLYAKLIAQDALKEKNARKFTPKLIRTLTGLNDNEFIQVFMVFCSFHDDFINESTDLEFSQEISRCYDEYRR